MPHLISVFAMLEKHDSSPKESMKICRFAFDYR